MAYPHPCFVRNAIQINQKTTTRGLFALSPYLVQPKLVRQKNILFQNTDKRKKSIAFGNVPRREAESQPINQSVRQAVTKTVNQASTQADRNTQFGFCQWQTRLQTVGRTVTVTNNGRMVLQPTTHAQVSSSIPSRPTAGRPVISAQFHPRSNLFEHKLLNPPPPKKNDIQFQGIEASESKNPLGDRFIGQNNDFYKGLDIQYHALG